MQWNNKRKKTVMTIMITTTSLTSSSQGLKIPSDESKGFKKLTFFIDLIVLQELYSIGT